MIKKRILSTVCAAAIGFSCMTGLSAYAQTDSTSAYSSQTASIDAVKLDLPVERLSGSNRYATAAVISQKGHPNGAKNVVLANAQNYADALCASPLAKALDAPILLNPADMLVKETEKELDRLGAENVYILGGMSAIDETVEKKLKDKKLNVTRIAGDDRYSTSAQAAATLQKLAGKPSLTAFFVSAKDFPDALSASSIAAVRESPIFYVDESGKLDDSVKDYLANCGRKLGYAYIIGGTGAVSENLEEEVKPYFNESGRYGGSNRYETNIRVNTALNSFFKGKDLCVATGKNFPDALAGGIFAAQNGLPLMLADGEASAKQIEYLSTFGVTPEKGNKLIAFGGETAVSESTLRSVLLVSDPTLSVDPDGDTKAVLKWAHNAYITSYQLYRGSALIATITDPEKTTYVDSGLKSDQSYTYRIVYNYTYNKIKCVSDASAELKRKGFDYHELLDPVNTARLNSEKNNTPKYSFRTENAQGASSTNSYYDVRYSLNDWATLEKFAKEHFTADMTKAEKVAYTVNWINKNVWYGTVADGGWAKIMAMVQNGTFSYVNCIFNYKIGQCNCYNGALASMMLYLGYDAHLVMGYRGKTNEKGVDTGNHWQHFWCEVKINGQTYVMEAGNYGEDGDWMHVCELYKDVENRYTYTEGGKTKTGWHGYLKNGKIAL